MADTARPPLRWESSTQPCHSTTSDTLPTQVVTCLQNARFLHLATCTQNTPHVSLMNYTYLPSHPFPSSHTLPSGPIIVMTSNPSSKKTTNLIANPNVSLLVHDWVSSRPPNTLSGADRERSPASGPRSSLAAMLMQMNSAAVSSISATINGEATVLEPRTEEERWCKEQHLMNNTFDEADSEGRAGTRNADALFGTSPEQGTGGRGGMLGQGDSGREAYIEDNDVRVVVVRIRDGRISDWKGGVKDWKLGGGMAGEGLPTVNGIGS